MVKNSQNWIFLIALFLLIPACTSGITADPSDIEKTGMVEVSPSTGNPDTDHPMATETDNLLDTKETIIVPPTPETICRTPDGEIKTFEISDESIPKPVRIQVCLPPCFDEQVEKASLPVLYMLHGQSFDDQQWIRLGLCETASKWIQTKAVQPFLIVLPFEEYSLTSAKDSFFDDALMETIIPWIDSKYPTCTERECRAIGGISRGGGWAFHIGFPNWETFGAIGCHSVPPLAYSDFNVLPFWLDEIPEGNVPALYLDIGHQDRFYAETLRFHEVLAYYDIAHEWVENQGQHDEVYWSAHVEDYLKWYVQVWESQESIE